MIKIVKQIILALMWAVVGGFAGLALAMELVAPLLHDSTVAEFDLGAVSLVLGAVIFGSVSLWVMRREVLRARIPEEPTSSVDAPPLMRIVATCLAIVGGILAVGFWGKINPLPTGPANEEFVFSAIQVFLVAGLAGYFVYAVSISILGEFKSDFLRIGNFMTTNTVVVVSVVLTVLAFVFPPISITIGKYSGSNLRWTPIWNIPRQFNIDIGVLLMEFIIIGIVGAGAFYLAKKRSTCFEQTSRNTRER